MNLFDAYGSASEHDMITRIGMDERYGVPPQGTFIETLAAVSEFIGHDDVFSHDWIVVQKKATPHTSCHSSASPPGDRLDEADRPSQPPEAGPTLDLPAAVIARSAPATSQSSPRPHFPDIMIGEDGMIVLCPGCAGSHASKDGDYFICRSCGSVWRRV